MNHFEKLCKTHQLPSRCRLLVATVISVMFVVLLTTGTLSAQSRQTNGATPTPTGVVSTVDTVTSVVTPTSTASSTKTVTLTPTYTSTPADTPSQEVVSESPTLTPPGASGAGSTEPPEDGNGQQRIIILTLSLGVLLLVVAGITYFLLQGEMPFFKSSSDSPPPITSPQQAPDIAAETREPVAAVASPVVERQPQPGTPYLESQNRPAGVIYCTLTQPTINIGRNTDNDLVIDQHFKGWDTVSRHHARIERDGMRMIIVDLDSENGVYVNGQRTGQNVLHDGDIVSLGQVRFVFRQRPEPGEGMNPGGRRSA